MKYTISSLIVCFILFLLNSSITGGNYVCETGGYEGADPFDSEQFKNKAAEVEAQLYNELAYYRRGWNLLMWNLKDHLLSLEAEKKTNLCKCVYTKMTGNTDFTNSKDVVTQPNFKMVVEKLGPNDQKSERNVTLTKLECAINNMQFSICEGYTPRFCRNCYDIYVIMSLPKMSRKANEYSNEIDENLWHYKVIGKVNMVGFKNLLI